MAVRKPIGDELGADTNQSRHSAPYTARIGDAFSKLASWSAQVLGSASAFVLASAACVLWAASGPLFHYSDTWQLVINTATTVLTFLAVFLIQNTQNREGKALQLKLDELIHAIRPARNRLIDLEHCSAEELEELEKEFARRRFEVDKTNVEGAKHRQKISTSL